MGNFALDTIPIPNLLLNLWLTVWCVKNIGINILESYNFYCGNASSFFTLNSKFAQFQWLKWCLQNLSNFRWVNMFEWNRAKKDIHTFKKNISNGIFIMQKRWNVIMQANIVNYNGSYKRVNCNRERKNFNCNNPYRSCHLQFLYTKSIAVSMQICFFSINTFRLHKNTKIQINFTFLYIKK